MDIICDKLRLSHHEMFKTISENVFTALEGQCNIIACSNDILFVWDGFQCCLMTLALKPFFRGIDKKPNPSKYQTLRSSNLPYQSVSQVVVSELCQQVALVCETRIYIVDLPKRWGADSEFEGGKPVITCKSKMLAPSGLNETVLQARWHPSSPGDNHLVVLYSDSILRMFDTDTGDIVHVVVLGPSHRKRGYSSLGDAAVDFDISPPVTRQVCKKSMGIVEEVVWPILVLWANGDVLYVLITLTTESINTTSFSGTVPPVSSANVAMCTLALENGGTVPLKLVVLKIKEKQICSAPTPVVRGPLQIFPPADDNYGGDASAIMILETTPPVVVISSCSGTLYHALMLETYSVHKEDNEDIWPVTGSVTIEHNVALYMFEAVELELGMSIQGEKTEAGAYSCPLRLMKDVNYFARYLCIHDTGIHLITMPIVLQLDAYAKSRDDDISKFIQSFSQHISSAEYMVCSRLDDTEVKPPVGVCIIPSPDTLVTILKYGDIVTLHLPFLCAPMSHVEEINEIPKTEEPKEGFHDYIKSILSQSFPAPRFPPLLKLDRKTVLPPKDQLEILSRAVLFHRNEIFPRHETAVSEIGKRVKALHIQKRHQEEDLELLEKSKIELKNKAEQLAEKYEEINDKQLELMKRGERLLLFTRSKSSHMTKGEMRMVEQLKEFKNKFDETTRSMEILRAKINAQKILKVMHKKVVDQKQQEKIVLSKKQARITKDVLTQMAADILKLKNRVENVKAFLKSEY